MFTCGFKSNYGIQFLDCVKYTLSFEDTNLLVIAMYCKFI